MRISVLGAAVFATLALSLTNCSLPGAREGAATTDRRRDSTVVDEPRRGPVELAQKEIEEAGELRIHPGYTRAKKNAVMDGAAYSPASPLPADDESQPPFNTETYDHLDENAFRAAKDHPLSTFSVDVDSASYSLMRRFLNDGRLPPPGAVRIEELVNYFDYDYAGPNDTQSTKRPFAVHTEIAPAPWNPNHRLVHIGIQSRRIGQTTTNGEEEQKAGESSQSLPPRNLVFLLDVSGSMDQSNKLPLLKRAMKLLTEQLGERDSVAIAVYAGASGVVLPPTSGARSAEILAALERLSAGGSTNGGEGIRLAYDLARKNFRNDGINRVILATDGDFNVGTTNQSELIRMIEIERESGVFLTVLGFGDGNYKDSTMEKLADRGNGNYAYIDNIAEARRVLVQQAGATLITVAKDVKLQVEFNPREVAAYRLIGYENRLLRSEDFNDDRKDAGEIGAGHSVTALYEIVPVGQQIPAGTVDPLRYQQPVKTTEAAGSGEMLTLKIRYKEPRGAQSELMQFAVRDEGRQLKDTSETYRFSAAVAAYGMLLRASEHKGQATYELARDLAQGAMGKDPHGYRAEFVRLISMARDVQ
jgi:Ca-activated chloride channel family protein